MKRCFLAFVVLFTLQGGAEASRLCATDFVAKVDTLKNDKASADSTGRSGGSKSNKTDKKKVAYKELLSKGGSIQRGLFTVRHIEDKWYFEIPERILNRMLILYSRTTYY